MHYYKRNIGDYHKKAGRLTLLQHGVYTVLMDAIYDREKFPTKEEAIDWCWASTSEEMEAVDFVLRKFFTNHDGIYKQKRIEEEIEAYSIFCEQQAEKGRKGGRPKANGLNKKPNGFENKPNETQNKAKKSLTTNHKPLTTNHIYPPNPPKGGNGRFVPPGIDEVSAYLGELKESSFSANQFCDFYQAQDWKLSNGNKMKDWKAAVRTWRSRRQAEQKVYGGNEI